MSETLDPAGPAPEARSASFWLLLAAVCAAPLFWLGQVMLAYGVTAYVCYPGDHPQSLQDSGPLFHVLMAFDVVALASCAFGAAISFAAWRRARSGHDPLRDGRNHFLAVWGLMSSLWFLAAILANAIASVTVPPCLT